ncbi:MAG: UvrD-helicase domain-containing protein [Burkholderiaceae bacterium]
MIEPLTDHPVLAPNILSGLHLLEADAGTGKTWTITRLVLRAIVERNIRINNIAVLTFTNAAAAELRARIGQLLDQWLHDANNLTDADDPFRLEWRHPVTADVVSARLRLARLQLDDAPIGTIHSYCQRILADNALSLGRWDKPSPGPTDDNILHEAVSAWWRENIVAGSADLANLCGPDGLSLSRLQAILKRALADPDAQIINSTGNLASLPARLQQAVDHLSATWEAEKESFIEWLYGSNFPLNKNTYAPDKLSALAQTFGDDLKNYPVGLNNCRPMLLYLDPARVALRKKKNENAEKILATFQSFSAAGALLDCLRERSHLSSVVASTIRDAIRHRVQEIQQRAGVIAFDDLLLQTRDALRDPAIGPVLASRLRARYQLTFVDEFQDTDPAQWDIFSHIYRPIDRELEQGTVAGTGLILVGDPKQAIYSFRNADINTYLGAAEVGATHHRLGQNHRSNHLLIDAVNALHDRSDPFATSQIGFSSARYGSKAGTPANQPPPDGLGALTIVQLLDEINGKPPNADALANLSAMVCAREVSRLLRNKTARPADIAVLVPTGPLGKKIYRALGKVGVNAVEIGRDTVYTSDEASDLFRIIAAIAAPSRSDLVRGALTTQLIGYDLAGLNRLAGDVARWQHLLNALAGARQRWAQAGPQASLRDLLFGDLNRASALAGAIRGERRLTNLLHLMSLLADEPSVGRSAAQGQAWLGRKIRYARDEGNNEQAQVRLESDDNLVSIQTVHVSKGLQFPFVFLPFAWRDLTDGGRANAVRVHHVHDPLTARRIIADGSSSPWFSDVDPVTDSKTHLARFARFQESLRLNYVALTRAERRCYVFWARQGIAGSGPSPLAYLLSRGLSRPQDPTEPLKKLKLNYADIDAEFEALDQQVAGVCLVTGSKLSEHAQSLPVGHDEPASSCESGEVAQSTGASNLIDANPSEMTVRSFAAHFAPSWISRSFTSLVSEAPSGNESQTVRPDHDQEQFAGLTDDSQRTDALQAGWPPDQSDPSEQTVALSFPRGANPGSCLHDILENTDFTQPVDPAKVTRRLRQWSIVADPTAVADWMNLVLASELPGQGVDAHREAGGAGFRLNRVPLADTIRELSFTLSVDALSPAALSRTIGEYVAVPLLQDNQWHGFLNGFIDLLVRIDGRYWIVDWKSNWLGPEIADYQSDKLMAAMVEHAYTLQMSLYTVAVHRMLRARIPDYRYESHFGGIRYLFLRGMTGDRSGNGVFSARLPESLVSHIDDLLGGAAHG